MSRKTKSISFDLTDEHERGLLEFVESKERGKFSRYIKRLIAMDKTGMVKTVPEVSAAPVKPKVIEDDTMNSFL